MEKKNMLKILVIVNLMFSIVTVAGVAYLVVKNYHQSSVEAPTVGNFNGGNGMQVPNFDEDSSGNNSESGYIF